TLVLASFLQFISIIEFFSGDARYRKKRSTRYILDKPGKLTTAHRYRWCLALKCCYKEPWIAKKHLYV
ncbi:MAG: hypothetical protein ACI9ES_002372, partial [Oceanospirillaceae bacterium]